MYYFKDKYNLTQQQSVFLSKKLIANTVYCGLQMEGTNMTFPDTLTILHGVNVPNATLGDIEAILNMRDAWRFVLNSIDEPFTLDYVCKINSFAARGESLEWGIVRTGGVMIDGSDYIPKIPNKNEAKEFIITLISSDKSWTEKAIEYFICGCKLQLFWDGNKRTSLISANKIMIEHGVGMINIGEKHINTFNHLLTEFYEESSDDNKKNALKSFLYENCICGIMF